MNRPYRKKITINDVEIIFSSAYEDDFLIVKDNKDTIAIDISNREDVDTLILFLKSINTCNGNLNKQKQSETDVNQKIKQDKLHGY